MGDRFIRLHRVTAACTDGIHSALIRLKDGGFARPVRELRSSNLRQGHLPHDSKMLEVGAFHKSGLR